MVQTVLEWRTRLIPDLSSRQTIIMATQTQTERETHTDNCGTHRGIQEEEKAEEEEEEAEEEETEEEEADLQHQTCTMRQ